MQICVLVRPTRFIKLNLKNMLAFLFTGFFHSQDNQSGVLHNEGVDYYLLGDIITDCILKQHDMRIKTLVHVYFSIHNCTSKNMQVRVPFKMMSDHIKI